MNEPLIAKLNSWLVAVSQHSCKHGLTFHSLGDVSFQSLINQLYPYLQVDMQTGNKQPMGNDAQLTGRLHKQNDP